MIGFILMLTMLFFTITACFVLIFLRIKRNKKLDEIIKLLKTLGDDAEHEEIYNMVQERKLSDNGKRYTMDDLRRRLNDK